MMPQESAVNRARLAPQPRAADDEPLFARDVGGRLIRMQHATAGDFEEDVHLAINGQKIIVKRAVPTVDSQGAVVRGANGQPIPRYTTIYDAAALAFAQDQHPIPTLCHREHLPPVGVCRVCIVEAVEMSRRGLRRQLVPACVQPVSDGMEVHTFDSPADLEAAARVRQAAQVITELLLADHGPPADMKKVVPGQYEANELVQVAKRLGCDGSRFEAGTHERGQDTSGHMIAVHHDECIMCRRCERGCSWVKNNNVIGIAGKGYDAHIVFDLDQPMAASNCVSCGECAASCPTGALTFTPKFLNQQAARVERELFVQQKDGWIVDPQLLVQQPLFQGLPLKFLQLHGIAVLQRTLKAGDVLCRQGDQGGTAYIINSGSFDVSIEMTDHKASVAENSGRSWWNWLGRKKPNASSPGTNVGQPAAVARLADFGGREIRPDEILTLDMDDVIYGEASCWNRSPRSATVIAREPSEVLEIRRNVLELLLQHRYSREVLESVYRRRATHQIQQLEFFSRMSATSRDAVVERLKGQVEIVHVDPGQVIFHQGEPVDYFYMIRSGFVKIAIKEGNWERVVTYLGPGKHFGELAILTELGTYLPGTAATTSGVRLTSCTALDHVELFRIRGSEFRALLESTPDLRDSMVSAAQAIFDRDAAARQRLQSHVDPEFLNLGLYGAHHLLVLDLERCTRCDECVKACADTHGGVTRLIRDGLRFDRFLIASACRSCVDPFCLAGCPVDAIHRHGELNHIEIEDYCIGCGLCAQNCPYGSINMTGFSKTEVDPYTGKTHLVMQEVDGQQLPVIQQRATTCDMCHSIDDQPSCVYACPHHAAFRVDSQTLTQMVRPSTVSNRLFRPT